MEHLKVMTNDYIAQMRDSSPEERKETAQKAFAELSEEARRVFEADIAEFRDNLPDLMSLKRDPLFLEQTKKDSEEHKGFIQSIKDSVSDTAKSIKNEQNVKNVTEESEKRATHIIRDLRTIESHVKDLRLISGQDTLADEYEASIADLVSEELFDIWSNTILTAYSEDEVASNELWNATVDLTSYCIAITEQCIAITGDSETMGNVLRYEHLIRMHDFSIHSCGWAYDSSGSVNTSLGFGRRWHQSDHLDDREVTKRMKKINGYENTVAHLRKLIAGRDFQASRDQQKKYWEEHPEAREEHEKLLEKEKQANQVHIKKAEEYLENGNRRMAALEYWRGADFAKSRETYDLRCLIAAGQSHTLGLKADGTVVCAGDGKDGSGNDTRVLRVGKWKNIVAVAASNFSSIGLSISGSAVTAGYNRGNNLSVALWHDVIQVSAASNHTVGLQRSGHVSAIGNNSQKQCATTGWSDIKQVSAGAFHTLGLKNDGTVVACGTNDSGRCAVGKWNNIVMIAAGGGHSVGLKSDGTVVACGQNDEGQCNVEAWHDIVSIAAGQLHTIGIRRDGTVVATGLNDRGQCRVSKIRNAVAAAAANHTVILHDDGTVECVGDNKHSQNHTRKWNLFAMSGSRGKGLDDAALKEAVEELNALKDTYRTLGRLAFRKRKEVWNRILELEKEISGTEEDTLPEKSDNDDKKGKKGR